MQTRKEQGGSIVVPGNKKKKQGKSVGQRQIRRQIGDISENVLVG